MRTLAVWLALGFLAPSVAAKRLPIRTYTTADGLARDHIRCVVQDSHGFLWFCTTEGLSRFDGYRFTNYHTTEGLPSNVVSAFLETHDGRYWVATNGGVCRFDSSGSPRFRCFSMKGQRAAIAVPYVLYEDQTGGIWCGTNTSYDGLFHMAPNETAFRHVDLPMKVDATVTAILEDTNRSIWVGSGSGLHRIDPDGTKALYTTADGLPGDFIMALREDHQGILWAGTRGGLARLDFPLGPHQKPEIRAYTVADGLPGKRVESLLVASDGTLWIGTTLGLAELSLPAAERPEFQTYSLAQGLSAISVGPLAEDRDGNLWIGTYGSGVMKIARSGFTTFTDAEGISNVAAILESRRDELVFVSRPSDGLRLVHFDGRRFVTIQPRWPTAMSLGWGENQIITQDSKGDWWIATGKGVFRFDHVDHVEQLSGATPRAIYGGANGLLGDNVFRVFADSHDNIWIGTIGSGQDGFARWNRADGTITKFSKADGFPVDPIPTAFAEDRAGGIWIGLFHGGRLAVYRNGRFTVMRPSEGVPAYLHTLFVDSSGRLWIGTNVGLFRIEDPTSGQPQLRRYQRADGLASDDILAITEDRWRHIYLATGRGIDRFEPQPDGLGLIRHYTSADGIAPGELNLAFRDRRGVLWFNTALGVSQFVPGMDRPKQPPVVLVTGLTIGGVARPVSDLGEASVSGVRLPERPLEIDFVALGFSPGEVLRYQYMLEGADRDWSAYTDQRSVIYANLSPGKYRFLVRAVTADGFISQQPASVGFVILPPFWRTWWFLSCSGLALALAAFMFHRYRLSQAVALANVRTRIATDLHDDIGASLSQIAILSEVAQRLDGGAEHRSRVPLTEIAGISRELLDRMSDIVWAISPDHDLLSDLVHRMRRFANDVLGGQDIALQFQSSIGDHDLKIGPNLRRQVYLMFKEAVNNIARHSRATRASVELDASAGMLSLRVGDDGRGFEPNSECWGHGLANIRKRAISLDGNCELQSAPGKGCLVHIQVRLDTTKSLSALRGKSARNNGRLKP